MKMNRENKKVVAIKILTVIVILLLLFIAFVFLIRPAFNSYILNKQITAQKYIFADMVNQLQTTGVYKVSIGNQTLILVPYQANPVA